MIKEKIQSLYNTVGDFYVTYMKSYVLQAVVSCSLLLISIVFLLLSIALTTLLERKVLGSVQRRRGPNVAGLFGFLQPIADGLKLLLKELIAPTNANLAIFFLAPIFTFFCSILLWLVIPFDQAAVLLDSPYSMLYLLAVSSLAVYGIIFSGWSSNSKYAFLGGLRSSAQMISYEVCMTFIFVAICIMARSFNIVDVVKVQDAAVWFVSPLLPLWIVFFIVALAETNRAPFDLPEAEAELVAGYNVEYASIAFALFFLGEYANIILMSSLCTLFFWGGWLPLFNISGLYIAPYLWFSIKVTLHVGLFIWVRAALPRYRYDQLMKLGWKQLIPFTGAFVFFVALMVYFIHNYSFIIEHVSLELWNNTKQWFSLILPQWLINYISIGFDFFWELVLRFRGR